MRAQGHQSLFASLALHHDLSLIHIQIFVIDAHQFADAEARGIQGFQDGSISSTEQVGGVGGREQPFDLLEIHSFWQSLFLSWGADQQHGVVLSQLSLFQPTVERAEGRDFSRHGRGRVFLFGQSRQEGSDAIRVCPQDQAGHGIAARIALIEGQRFGRFVCGFSEGSSKYSTYCRRSAP